MKLYKNRLKLMEAVAEELTRDVSSLTERLNLQTATDAYKDDLISTLKELLTYKEERINALGNHIQELQNK